MCEELQIWWKGYSSRNSTNAEKWKRNQRKFLLYTLKFKLCKRGKNIIEKNILIADTEENTI
jgi:hypothetical protein